MARRFNTTCQLTAYDDSDNSMTVGSGAVQDPDRTGDLFNLIRTTSNVTIDTDDAVDLGAVPDGAMEFGISNLSATPGEDIKVSLNYSGTHRIIGMVYAGQTRVFSLLSRPYVQCHVASVPYLAGVAVL